MDLSIRINEFVIETEDGVDKVILVGYVPEQLKETAECLGFVPSCEGAYDLKIRDGWLDITLKVLEDNPAVDVCIDIEDIYTHLQCPEENMEYSSNHLFLTTCGYVQAQDLNEKDNSDIKPGAAIATDEIPDLLLVSDSKDLSCLENIPILKAFIIGLTGQFNVNL